ncbi:MAG: FtsX-like permease family protein, partial [Eubacterium sp.]|nr:FtsX-like permease family protein [Eubacterium sp.]
YKFFDENNCIDVPAAFVADKTETELGGKEKLVAYVNSDIAGAENYNESLWNYLSDNGFRANDTNIRPWEISSNAFGSISKNSYLMVVIVLVLIFASCVAIINSFNTNLKERKKQIGMMRAVGTTKRQIVKIFGREAFIISLISVPISIALSYGIVWGIITLANKEAIMTKSIVVLPVCAVVCLIITMMASLLPLLSAAKITPMQAIRDIDNTRKMKTKKIKSKMHFNVSSHLAKRNLTFYKGGLIAVSIILSITIVFSCFCFSALSKNYGKVSNSNGADYYVYSLGAGYAANGFENYEGGMSDADKQSIASMPYVAEVRGTKSLNTAVETKELTDFHKVGCYIYDWDIDDLTYENAAEKMYSKFSEEYLDFKKEYGFQNDVFSMGIYGQETDDMEILKKYVTSGEINMNKIAKGEEVVLVAPNTVKQEVRLDKGGGLNTGVVYDDRPVEKDYQVVLEGENPYKVGDTLSLTTVMMNEDTGKKQVTKKDVVIGAIISLSSMDEAREKENRIINSGSFSLLTTNAGITNFCKNVKYEEAEIYADRELDEETDKLLTDSLQEFADK